MAQTTRAIVVLSKGVSYWLRAQMIVKAMGHTARARATMPRNKAPGRSPVLQGGRDSLSSRAFLAAISLLFQAAVAAGTL